MQLMLSRILMIYNHKQVKLLKIPRPMKHNKKPHRQKLRQKKRPLSRPHKQKLRQKKKLPSKQPKQKLRQKKRPLSRQLKQKLRQKKKPPSKQPKHQHQHQHQHQWLIQVTSIRLQVISGRQKMATHGKLEKVIVISFTLVGAYLLAIIGKCNN